MVELHVLVIGNLVRNPDGSVAEAHSTSTLLRTRNLTAVVDTSSAERTPHIRTSMRKIGIRPEEVGLVVHTHPHHDHVGNDGLFPRAKVMDPWEGVPGQVLSELAGGVTLVATPGHTLDSASVFVESDGVRYAICGDAVPLRDNLERMVPPGICADRGLAMESLNTISRFADIVVPGHGPPFHTDG